MRSLLLGVALVLAAPGQAVAGEVVRRALVVGANDGGVDLEPLRHAETDAGRVADILGELGGFAATEVTLVTAATREAVVAALDEVAAQPVGEGTESLFLFYYSGHADTRGLRLQGDVLTYEELKALVREVPAEVHLGILDACRSGAISRVKGAAVADPFLDEQTLAAEGEAWIAASSADEDAQESDQLEGSFFTHYLVSGLRGAADDGDGVVSLTEAYDYAHERTVARTVGTAAGTQHPSYDYRLQGNGDLPLTDVRRASAAVLLPEEVAGVVTVLREPDHLPVAEAAKASGRTTRLALPPGQYLLRLRDGGTLRQVRVGLTSGATLAVDRWGDAQGEVASAKGATPVWIGEVPEGGTGKVPGDGLRIEKTAEGDGVVIRVEGKLFGGMERGLERLGESVGRRLGGRGEPQEVEEVPDVEPEELGAEGTLVEDSVHQVDGGSHRLPGLAASVNVVVPGLGQMIQGRWGPGIAFLGGSYLLTGGSYVGAAFAENGGLAAGSSLGPNLGTMAGTALWMWSIADAAWVDRTRFDRPRVGVTMSMETAWHEAQWLVPHGTGLSADWIFHPGLSIGLNRVGFVNRPDGVGVFSAGVRGMAAFEGKRFRPGLVLAFDNRHYWEVDALAPLDGDYVRPVFHPETQATYVNTWIIGVGSQLRWYATPRYFLQGEIRWEVEPATGDDGLTAAGGIGVHLGER